MPQMIFMEFSLSPGESVPVEEQLSSRNKKSSSETAAVMDSVAPPPIPLSDEEKTQYEVLITDLYQQLDDKVSLSWPKSDLMFAFKC